MAQIQSPISAKLQMSFSARDWAACIAVWFIAMAAIAILAGDKPAGIPALMAVFVGGVFVLGGFGVLTLLGGARRLRR